MFNSSLIILAGRDRWLYMVQAEVVHHLSIEDNSIVIWKYVFLCSGCVSGNVEEGYLSIFENVGGSCTFTFTVEWELSGPSFENDQFLVSKRFKIWCLDFQIQVSAVDKLTKSVNKDQRKYSSQSFALIPTSIWTNENMFGVNDRKTCLNTVRILFNEFSLKAIFLLHYNYFVWIPQARICNPHCTDFVEHKIETSF